MSFRNSILAGELLVRSGIKSGDYVPGVSGWRIARDGSAEFSDATIRGEVTASSFRGATPDNLATNPGFEDGTTGWAVLDPSTSSLTVASSAPAPDPDAGGTQWGKVTRTSGAGDTGVYQSIPCSPGDVIQAGALMSKSVVVFGDVFVITLLFYDAGNVLLRSEARQEQCSGLDWQYVEKVFAVPEGQDWADVATVVVSFSADLVAGAYIGVDDVTIAKAPSIEIPYLVTNPSADYARGYVAPDVIGFQRGAGYPVGLHDVRGDLQVWGPLAPSGTIPRLDLELDSMGLEGHAQLTADEVAIGTPNNRVYPAVVCRAYRWTPNQTLANNSDTTIVFNTVAEDSDSAYDASTGIYTVPVAGLYLIGATLRFQTNVTGVRQGVIRINGNAMTVSREEAALWGTETLVSLFWIDRLTAGSQVRVSALQNSGGNLTVNASSSGGTNLRIIRLGE